MLEDEENELIALKSRLWRMGFDENNPETTISENKDRVPEASTAVFEFLCKYPGNTIARKWKIILEVYVSSDNDGDLEDTLLPIPAVVLSNSHVPLHVDPDGEKNDDSCNHEHTRLCTPILGLDLTPPVPAFPLSAPPAAVRDLNTTTDPSLRHGRKRALQKVSTKEERRKVVKWMIANETPTLHIARIIEHFPDIFNGKPKNDCSKCSRWWKQRATILSSQLYAPLPISVTQSNPRSASSTNRRVPLKLQSGRGPRTSPWVLWLYGQILSEFHRLRKANVKFSRSLIQEIAVHIIKNSEHPHFNIASEEKGRPIIAKLTFRWVQRFMEKKNIIMRSQSGKLMISAVRQLHIYKTIAYHLGAVSREHMSGTIDECIFENVDETHFIVNMDNGKTLAFRGEKKVKYSDVVSGGQGMTMVVRITGGPDGQIEVPYMIFQNDNSSYPIRGVPDNVPGVSYRTSKSGFINQRLWVEWLQERRTQRCSGQSGRTRHIWCDIASGHAETDASTAVLRRINATVRKLVPNAADRIQPADSFVIAKIKSVWREKWEKRKLNQIMSGNGFKDSGRRDGRISGALRNPGKGYFLRLAADVIREVNNIKDTNGMSMARKQCSSAVSVWKKGCGKCRS